jgi:hypothetical protein
MVPQSIQVETPQEREIRHVQNKTCNSENNSVRIRREIDESIRNLTREIIRLRRLKEVV